MQRKHARERYGVGQGRLRVTSSGVLLLTTPLTGNQKVQEQNNDQHGKKPEEETEHQGEATDIPVTQHHLCQQEVSH